MSKLSDLGEKEIIRRLAALVPGREDVKLGIADDAAVVRMEQGEYDLLLTSDPLIEGTHFERGAPPRQVGHKAMGRTMSDIAAMGGEPLWSLINLAAPADTPWTYVEEVYQGAAALADRYGMAIVGGDTSEGPALELNVFTVGRLPAGSAITRAGAKPGDLIYVTGTLGGSRQGKHLAFEPRITEGLWLREQGWAHAMIDVTDGLAGDLLQLLAQSGVGAELDRASIPMSTEAAHVEAALKDGEDFELLFTTAAENQLAFESNWRETFDLTCTPIGRITPKAGLLFIVGADGVRRVLEDKGYEHFQ